MFLSVQVEKLLLRHVADYRDISMCGTLDYRYVSERRVSSKISSLRSANIFILA